MRETVRPGRGERGRIAAEVRALLREPAAGSAADGPTPGPADPGLSARSPGVSAWLPGEWLDVGSSPRTPGEPLGAALGPRWQPDRRAVTAVAIAVLVAGLITAWWVLSARPRHLAVQASPAGSLVGSTASSGTAAAPGTSASGAPGTSVGRAPGISVTGSASGATSAPLVVDVAGKVRSPGVYRLPAGSRVIDAVRAAGGARHGVSTNSLNLAAPLQDGEQVLVGAPGQAPAGQPDGVAGTTGAGAGGPVRLNSATLEQLETLPGVGPVLAQRILDWRTQHGSFTSVAQLDEVSGIGPAKFAQLRDAVTL